MEHYLKIKSKYFSRILSKDKTFEVRFNDRDYQVGDTIRFEVVSEPHYNNEGLTITDHGEFAEENFKIIYILNYPEALKDGWVVLGIELTNPTPETEKEKNE